MTIELPEHLRTGPLAEAAARALQDAQSMASSSNSVPRISLRGREFRLVENGEETHKFRDKLDVIIVGVEPEAGRMVKTFYKDGYKSGAKEPPTCSSDDGIAPAVWVNDKQSNQCNNCPKNIFGSATSINGKPTKACRDSKRVWLKLAPGNTPSGQNTECAEGLKPFADRTLFGLNITVASLKTFSEHGRKLASMGQGPAVCVTRLIMLDKEFPELDFEIIAWLDANDAPKSLQIASERPWKISYANAGLALSHDASPAKSSLPTSLPGQPPAHLQSVNVIDAQPSTSTSKPIASIDIDDAIAKF